MHGLVSAALMDAGLWPLPLWKHLGELPGRTGLLQWPRGTAGRGERVRGLSARVPSPAAQSQALGGVTAGPALTSPIPAAVARVPPGVVPVVGLWGAVCRRRGEAGATRRALPQLSWVAAALGSAVWESPVSM